jgi:hypothetical protein
MGNSVTGKGGGHTNVLLSCSLVWYLGADNADKNSHFISRLVDLVQGPIDALEGRLGNHIRASLSDQHGNFTTKTKFVLSLRPDSHP